MASYRARAYLFVDGAYIPPGAKFTSGRVPGRNWEPLDDAARSAVAKRQAEIAAKPPQVLGITQPDGTLRLSAFDRMEPAATDIPDDWRSLHNMSRRAIALKLGAPRQIKLADADAMIEREVARRAQVAA